MSIEVGPAVVKRNQITYILPIMNLKLRLVAALALLSPLLACQPHKIDVAPAQDAATSWLALTDSGKYAESWDAAAAFFKAAVPQAAWTQMLQTARAPLGALKSRQLKSAAFTRSIPGAPDGEYVVVQFDAQFENKAAAVETVTPMREKDGSWRVSGYFIK